MTALQYFRLFAPEFASVSDEDAGIWIAMAQSIVDASRLGSPREEMAQALYAAHMLALAQRTESGGAFTQGAVTSEKEGDLSRSYGEVTGSNSYLGQTAYGLQYMDLMAAGFGATLVTRFG